MSTTKHNSEVVQATPAVAQLSDEERKLVERFDQRASHRPERSRRLRKLQSTAFFLPWWLVVVA